MKCSLLPCRRQPRYTAPMIASIVVSFGFNAVAQTPAPSPKPELLQITAIQAPNSNAAIAQFQQAPGQRPRLLPEGIIQFIATPSTAPIVIANPKAEKHRLVLEMTNATLSNQKPLQLQNPYPGIAQITLSPLTEKTLQLSIVGEKSLPTVVWSPRFEKLTVTACSGGFLPDSSEAQAEGSTRLLYDVDAAGCPQNIQIAQSSGRANFDAWAVGELKRRQLQPNRPSQAMRLRITYKPEEPVVPSQPQPGGVANPSSQPTKSP